MTAEATDKRRGEWILTASGRQMWPLDVRPDDILIEDVAHHLANICRFGGACRVFYSVAEHCVRASYVGDDAEALARLLHDGPEYVLGDVVRPLKRGGGFEAYTEAEDRAAAAFCVKFGLPDGALDAPGVKHADAVMLATEKRDLTMRTAFVGGHAQGGHAEPLAERVKPWSAADAHQRFLARYYVITGTKHTFMDVQRVVGETRPLC